MATLAFDTHKAVKAPREAGFDDVRAEAVAAQMSAATGENLVTKDDLGKAIEKLEWRIAAKVYAAVVVGVGSIKALDFLVGRSSFSSRIGEACTSPVLAGYPHATPPRPHNATVSA